ncbi:hypothetical protein ACFLZI_02190 [Nitrospirota bacterium]
MNKVRTHKLNTWINVNNYIQGAAAFVLIISFKVIGPLVPQQAGWLHVLFYWVAFTTLISMQIFRFRTIIKTMLLTRILREDYWVTGWLKRNNQLIALMSIIASALLALNLMSFLYSATLLVHSVLFVDSIFFVFLYRRVRLSFPDRAFQVDIAELVHEYTPFLLNVIILFAGFTIVALFDRSNVYDIDEFVRFPDYASEAVAHPVRLFRGYVRTMYLMEITLKSLRSLSDVGWVLYLAVYLTTISLAANVAVSLLYKAFIRGGGKEKGECNES